VNTKLSRFEDLVAWQKARSLAHEVFSLTGRSPFADDPDLRSQLRRAATSVMSNVAEGFERFTRKDFAHYLLVAKASCAEVRSLLYLTHDVGYLGGPTFDRLMTQSVECARIIGGLRAAVRRCPSPPE
jgi:four helix bundle protein